MSEPFNGRLSVAKDAVSGSWDARWDGKLVTSANTRDEALFWGGWWVGRRELGDAVMRHIDDGGRADATCAGGSDE